MLCVCDYVCVFLYVCFNHSAHKCTHASTHPHTHEAPITHPHPPTDTHTLTCYTCTANTYTEGVTSEASVSINFGVNEMLILGTQVYKRARRRRTRTRAHMQVMVAHNVNTTPHAHYTTIHYTTHTTHRTPHTPHTPHTAHHTTHTHTTHTHHTHTHTHTARGSMLVR